ncbi:AMP-binding protein [Gordonia jinghuaiqii]|uniref:Acyl--CoA ligase n=1 Tax=Gordonia jinghuaiqii TaxID=2758710 RepID=A0A7D7QVI2_9ACTN|nr:class I adenylate-forming enzyme family protein [Gordonia jinghuaiqii]MCR5976599.1 AMP-binding protein [Gordonia jinghuaiqii]QMS99787.1 acyl--CoA ligase [Gordonia jinghuaiqii]
MTPKTPPAGIPYSLDRLWEAPDDARMVHSDGEWFTWGGMRHLVESIEDVLADAGLGPGSRVAMVLGNRLESIAALIAVLRTERTLVTLNPLQPPARLAADLRQSDPVAVLATPQYWDDAEFVAATGDSRAWGFSLAFDAPITLRCTGDSPAPTESHGVAVEMRTSGTTGEPKRIPLTYSQINASLHSAAAHAGVAPAEALPFIGRPALITLSIVHIGGMWALIQGLVQARPLAILERFTIDGWRAAIREHRPIVAGLPGAAIGTVLDADVPAEDLSSLRAVNAGTSPVDPDLVDAFVDRYGIAVLIVYGATEFSGAVAGWTIKDFRASWKNKKGSVGRPFPGVELSVVGENGSPVATGVTGRLRVRSHQSGTDADWTTTSDLAHLDADGFLYIDGRADDVIIRGGFKVSPEVVARALRSHASVADVAVAGVPDTRLGYVPVAGVELRRGARMPSGAELRDHCRSQLTPYEVPVAVHVFDELPRSASLKVDRRRLLEMFESAAPADGFAPDTTSRDLQSSVGKD